MVSLRELEQQRAQHFIPEAYKKYSGYITAKELAAEKSFIMIEPPIVRLRPSVNQPPEDKNTREDGSKIIWYTQTAYVPVQIREKQLLLIVGSNDLIQQFFGIKFDEFDDEEFKDSKLRFYQDKIDGPLKITMEDRENRKYPVPVLEDVL